MLSEHAAEFGLVPGEVYNLDMFQAERNPTGSNFRIETSLDFKECGVLETDIIR
jgi:fibro-slime domain-containing protein